MYFIPLPNEENYKEKNQVVLDKILSKEFLSQLKTESRYKENLQLNPVSIYTKFWTMSARQTIFTFFVSQEEHE